MSVTRRFKVELPSTFRPDRLDRVLAGLFENEGQKTSRATIQRWIKNGRILVDGVAVRAATRVGPHSVIEVDPEPPSPSSATPDPTIQLNVVFEDAHVLVIDKPQGLVVHPARGHMNGTLVNALLARPTFRDLAEDSRDKTGIPRPGIVHRLDKDTTGLLVVAKTEAARENLKAQFQAHTIEREYVAIVAGKANEATYDTFHGRHPKDRLRFTSHGTGGRRAVTHVRVLETLGVATLVACTLETGRTHQIRVHLLERAKTPILADKLYGRKPRATELDKIASELGRQALHARVLGFRHPATGKLMRWESPIPEDMQNAIRQLRALKESGAEIATRSSTSRAPST